MSSDTACIHCSKQVRKRQQALQCGGCDRWQHRTCETGITQAAYREAVKSGGSIDWSCNECENRDQHCAITDLVHFESRVSLVSEEISEEIPINTQLESTRTSTEVGQFELEISNLTHNSSTRALERSDFDVSREPRSLIPEVQEESVTDETINRHDVSEVESTVTFELVENGSTRGKRKLVSSDGYTFVHKKILKNGTDVWRCSVRGKNSICPATVNQRGDQFEPNTRSHIHPAKPGIDVAVKIKRDLKAESRKKIFDPSGNIVRDVVDRYNDPDLPEASRPLEATLKRLCNKTRSDLRPADPSDLNFTLDEDYLNQQIGEAFFRDDIKVGNRRHLIFATDRQLELLSRAKTWYLDGTFKVVAEPFYQLLSIHGFVKSGDNLKQLPLCFCVMSGKKTEDYKKVLNCILDLLQNNINVREFVVDFESGMWKALRKCFDQPKIHGCSFHFGQALWRNMQNRGLQPAYSRKDKVYKLLRKVFCLPFLPAEDIPAAFNSLMVKVDPSSSSLLDFMEYVKKNWIESSIWSVESWSVNGRSIRTNNDCEGYHNRLNQHASKGNLPFYLLLTLLFQEAKHIPLFVKMISEGKLKRRQRNEVRQTQGKLMELWESYNNRQISTSSFLKECAAIYAPNGLLPDDC